MSDIYPLIDNRKWYAENGTVYNEADDEVRIVLLYDSGSYSNLPNDIAEIIASALNNRTVKDFVALDDFDL